MPEEPDGRDEDLVAGFVAATQRELERLGKLDSMLGQQALIVARNIARGSGSEVATLSREHSRLMAAVEAGRDVAADPIEEAERRVAEARSRAAKG